MLCGETSGVCYVIKNTPQQAVRAKCRISKCYDRCTFSYYWLHLKFLNISSILLLNLLIEAFEDV
jgi:hypothetical protein